MSAVSASVALKVRQRAGDRCEYCRLPRMATQVPFEVEHIIPTKHDGDSSLDNLAWSCVFCNRYKGCNISGLHPVSRRLVSLFHPRKEVWGKHFKLVGTAINGRTHTGLVTVQVLRMNESQMRLLRLQLIAHELW